MFKETYLKSSSNDSYRATYENNKVLCDKVVAGLVPNVLDDYCVRGKWGLLNKLARSSSSSQAVNMITDSAA